MNRKKYQKPLLEVVNIKPFGIICSSLDSFDDSLSIGLGDADEGTGISADSRRRSLWDNDEEEDY